MTETIVSTRFPKENLLNRVYQVAITYCNDITAVHTHVDRDTAMKEYAEMLGEALEPTATHAQARHIRMVTLIIANDLGEQVAHINAGPVSCGHRD